MSITNDIFAGFASRLLIALVIALSALFAAGSGLASADESGAEADSPVLLEPGYNFVGWIGESIAVGDLFETIPQIEVVLFWDPAERTWRSAAPGVPARFWTLDAIDPGMAVLVWSGSEESVPWIAQTEPVLGRVELHEGTNWVSWAGPSGWSVDDVATGIGQSLLRVSVGDHDALPAQTSEELRRRSMLRGDPMVVEVARDVPWLQPTGLLPEISFFGDFSEERQQYYTDIVREVVGFFGMGFGLEADPNVLDIWIFERGVLNREGLPSTVRDVLTDHVTRNVATGSATRIVFPVSGTPVKRESTASVMLHEYFHALQQQLSGWNSGSAPVWITEGQAEWMEFKHDFTGPANSWQYYTDREVGSCGHVTLHAAQHRTFGCEYVLGVLATRLLDESVGAERLVEFWRQMVPRKIGPNGRWDSASRWEDAFGLAFGLTPDEFYGQYDQQRGRASATPPDSGSSGRTMFVEGHVRDGEGAGVAGVRVALTQASGVYLGYVSNAVTNAEGKFVAEVFAGERQRIQVFPLDGCGYWVGESAEPASRETGREFTFDSSSPSSLSLRLHAEFCKKVEGTVVSPEFGPLAGVQVWIAVGGTEWYPGQRSRGDGSFTLSVPREKSYRIGVNLRGDCSVYYRRGEPAGAWHEATDVRVSDSDVAGIHVEIPPDACILP